MISKTKLRLLRRFAAIIYDSLLHLAVLMLAALPPVLLNGGAIQYDGTWLSAIKSALLLVYFVAIIFFITGWCWTHGGQTLGMQAWRLRVVGQNDQPITWRQAWIRWSTACFGLANLSALFASSRLGWHERWSMTKTLFIEKKRRSLIRLIA